MATIAQTSHIEAATLYPAFGDADAAAKLEANMMNKFRGIMYNKSLVQLKAFHMRGSHFAATLSLRGSSVLQPHV
eukprot:CAMPEP_0195593598 /NCGR_PEP_ID=MMETSP0815-20121206/973_1 /TAXON_ID=97485 /ORGANISM="Prymnesium parvum, Strain Texoma1" /LENGTH=74 /DNA_ID=CAMNT_0040732755 /DNA_START=317 /DNA_END=542 /DNA_ORIENTATION=+